MTRPRLVLVAIVLLAVLAAWLIRCEDYTSFLWALPTIDQLGLNDAWVAEHGVRPREAYARPTPEITARIRAAGWEVRELVPG